MLDHFEKIRNAKLKYYHNPGPILLIISSTTVLVSLILVALLASTSPILLTYGQYGKSAINNNNDPMISTPRILDPNPTLISQNGSLRNDPSEAASILTSRIGTTADGISKLILVADYNRPLNFTITENVRNTTYGSLGSLRQSISLLSSSPSIVVNPENTSQGKSVAVAIYTPPDYLNLPKGINHKNINILVHDANDPSISVKTQIYLYRVPVVLIHGIWSNAKESWNSTKFNFTTPLENSGYNVTLADYGAHNATTFDPYVIPKIGNFGINAIRNAIDSIFKQYHSKDIAASQVDIVAHSMGGLMARGFAQQPDYKNQSNFMKGYIHRLITIGTPHFGGQLAELLYSHRNDMFCFEPATNFTLFPTGCQFDVLQFEFLPLKTIFADKYGYPIDKGGVEALAPGSIAYSHMCQTNVTSYAVAGSWAPNAFYSHTAEEGLYKNILGNLAFDLDRDGFQGNLGDNDLQVNLASQVGGLNSAFRVPSINNIPQPMPNEGAIYRSTVHSSKLISPFDQNVVSELHSSQIQNDVATLLGSPDTKFANAIGTGSLCHIPIQSLNNINR